MPRQATKAARREIPQDGTSDNSPENDHENYPIDGPVKLYARSDEQRAIARRAVDQVVLVYSSA